MGNQHLQLLSTLTNNETQLLISLYLGDGSYIKQSISGDYGIYTSSIHKELIYFKHSLVSTLKKSDPKWIDNSKGYNKNGYLYKFLINTDKRNTLIYNLPLESKLESLDELGLALWFYDDGSLHKNKLFYNLCTHSFSIEEQELMVQKLYEKFNIKCKLTRESKKDGRIFYYLRVSKYEGAFEIATALNNNPVQELMYKCWSSETIQKWSTIQENWKSEDILGKKKFFMKYMR